MSAGDRPRLPPPIGRAAWASLAALGGLFLLSAALRRLNFDEALALKAGWLLVERIPAQPDFLMPWTLALGYLGRAIDDPGALFLVARLATVALVAGCGWWALRQAAPRRTAALAAALALTQATVVVHALEFRYDAAILAGWLTGYGLLVRGRSRDGLWLGAVAAVLGFHHLKGLLFGTALLAAGLAVAAGARRDRGRRIVTIAAGALGTAGGWMALVAARGNLGELAGLYTTFGRLAGGEVERLSPWSALAEPLARDAAWWIAGLAALAASAVAIVRGGRPRRDPEAWALLFALVPIAFLGLHPHPWAYMLALPAPFVALLVARRLEEARRRWPRWGLPAALAGAVAVQIAAGGGPPLAIYTESLAASRAPQVESLRALRAAARPGDRVLDPSGLAWFLPPCSEEWYVDTLFRQRSGPGGWMSELATADLAGCRWLLYTYRLRSVPPAVQERLAGTYVLLPGALALHRDDPRLEASDPPWAGLREGELRSFW